MEKIREFLKIDNPSDSGSGYGYGSGRETGRGDGSGYGYGDGCGCGYGYGRETGRGDGYGDGDGCGCGEGSWFGDGDGYGRGDGFTYYNKMQIHIVDCVPTVITAVFNNVAKGFTVNDDLTLKPCYIVKNDRLFAHGETLKKALEALREKELENIDIDELIEKFIEEIKPNALYPAKTFFDWHHYITGSCEYGRNCFVSEHDIDVEHDAYTAKQFFDISLESSFGADEIKRVKEAWENYYER